MTDRCNLRCVYCMPPEGVPFKDHTEVLSYEEMLFFVSAALELGITKIRVTGGEPLVRRGLPAFIGMLRGLPGVRDISLTTNGILLPRFGESLRANGLNRINISLDSLDPYRYERLTRGGSLSMALEGIEVALSLGLDPVKLNVVMMPDLLEELPEFVALTRNRPLHVRFIEWMPMGGCGPRCTSDVVSKAHVVASLESLGAAGLGALEEVDSPGGWGPARYSRFPGHRGTLGFIGSVSDHFCSECNRLRLTSDGRLKNCLFSSEEIDVRDALRARDRAAVLSAVRRSLALKTFDKNLVPGSTTCGMSQVGG